jgi:hypothetical protein
VGGIPDAVAVPDSGALVAAGDYIAFADTVVGALRAQSDGATRLKARAFAASKDWRAFHARLHALLQRA